MKAKLAIILTLLSASRLTAQVNDIQQFKIAVYNQTSSSPPATPEAFFFGSGLDADPDLGISLPMVFTSSQDGFEFILNQNGPGSFGYGGPTYASKTNFDADYPNGEFDYAFNYFDINSNNIADNILIVTSLTDLYSTVLPAYSPDCWTAMQNVDPAADFPLAWNSYTAAPGADYAHTFIGSYDNTTFNSQYGSFNFDCEPYQTNVVIPAGTLQYGRSYSFLLYFSNRQTPTFTNDDGSTGTVIIGFDNQAHANLITIPPPLQIVPADTGVSRIWPVLASN